VGSLHVRHSSLWISLIKEYDNSQCTDVEEFIDDMRRFKYIKRLLRQYVISRKELKERLVLNHLTVLANVFPPAVLQRLLFTKLDPPLYPALKAFLEYLFLMPETIPGVNGETIERSTLRTDARITAILHTL
jgi:hypothetical protein